MCEVEEQQAVRVEVQSPKWRRLALCRARSVNFEELFVLWCDNQCSAHHQIAAMVREGGGDAHTINLCKRCYNERCSARRKGGGVEGDYRTKSIPWQAVDGTIYARDVGTLHRQKSMG